MQQDTEAVGPGPSSDAPSAAAWAVVQAAAVHADRAGCPGQPAAFAVNEAGQALAVPADDPQALVAWRGRAGWEPLVARDDPRRALLDLYLPICSATTSHPVTIGHLGQSLDGFIATRTGDSRWVTGRENILHLHRLRALCDAVVVGAETVSPDDPQLTTRLVHGPNPLRVILDPRRRLGVHHQVFSDRSAETLYVCSRSLARPGEHCHGLATIAAVDETADGLDIAALVGLLHTRGCTRIFVEGGGVTVSMFVRAGLLDRLHMAIAPLIIGDGRPAIRLPARAMLGDCQRPRYRVFRMGGDVLFDCDLRSRRDEDAAGPMAAPPGVARII